MGGARFFRFFLFLWLASRGTSQSRQPLVDASLGKRGKKRATQSDAINVDKSQFRLSFLLSLTYFYLF